MNADTQRTLCTVAAGLVNAHFANDQEQVDLLYGQLGRLEVSDADLAEALVGYCAFLLEDVIGSRSLAALHAASAYVGLLEQRIDVDRLERAVEA